MNTNLSMFTLNIRTKWPFLTLSSAMENYWRLELVTKVILCHRKMKK